MEAVLKYARFHPPHNGMTAQFANLITCYQEIFSEDPWHEWKTCLKCSKELGENIHWGKESAEMLQLHHFECPKCITPLEEFWPKEVVESDFRHEVTKDASCWITETENGEVLGFCLGYPITPQELGNKLKIPNLSQIIFSEFGLVDEVAYQDDVGVKKEWRGQGIAKEMFNRRLQDFRDRGLKIGIARVKRGKGENPSVSYLWFLNRGYKIIAEYQDIPDRVILARTLEGL